MKKILGLLFIVYIVTNIIACKKETDLKSPFDEMKSKEDTRETKHKDLKEKLMDGNNKDYYN